MWAHEDPGFFKKPGVWDDVKPDATGFGRGVLGGLADRWKKAQYLFGKDDLSLYLAVRALFTPDEVARLIDASVDETRNLLKELSPGRMALEPIEFLSAMETKFYLQNQLLRDTDFMSMFHSIETRVPYVDYVLMECVQKTSPRLRVHRGVSKPLLANPLADSLPRDIIHRRKQGFTFPFALWLGKSNGRFLDGVVRNGMLSQKRVFELWQGFREGRMHWSRVWALAVADRWLR